MAAPLVNRGRTQDRGESPCQSRRKRLHAGACALCRRAAQQPRAARSTSRRRDTRSPYARDRDRILHTTAFRRLNYKTQVFIYHEGDHYRSRLTHSLEVAQIARALARTLRVDEDLTEASGVGSRPRPPAVRPCRRARARCRHDRTPAASTTTRSRCASSPSWKRNMRASTDSISPGRRSRGW